MTVTKLRPPVLTPGPRAGENPDQEAAVTATVLPFRQPRTCATWCQRDDHDHDPDDGRCFHLTGAAIATAHGLDTAGTVTAFVEDHHDGRGPVVHLGILGKQAADAWLSPDAVDDLIAALVEAKRHTAPAGVVPFARKVGRGDAC